MNKIFIALYLSMLLCVSSAFAEPAGTWKLYNSYTNITKVDLKQYKALNLIGNEVFKGCSGISELEFPEEDVFPFPELWFPLPPVVEAPLPVPAFPPLFVPPLVPPPGLEFV